MSVAHSRGGTAYRTAICAPNAHVLQWISQCGKSRLPAAGAAGLGYWPGSTVRYVSTGHRIARTGLGSRVWVWGAPGARGSGSVRGRAHPASAPHAAVNACAAAINGRASPTFPPQTEQRRTTHTSAPPLSMGAAAPKMEAAAAA
eukprot:2798218-Rhodomonas_salina.3